MIPPCGRCGGAMPAASLDQVYVTCPYCGLVAVAPPPPASAWLAQHHELVREPTRIAAQMNRLGTWMVLGWVMLICAGILVGFVKQILRAL